MNDTKHQQQREPRFLSTGLLILVPVLALGGVGLWQLRQDRAAAFAEVRAEAEAALESLVARASLVTTGATAKLHLSPDGHQMIYPRPIPPVPIPSAEISPEAIALAELLDNQQLTDFEKAKALEELARTSGRANTAAGIPVKQLAWFNALRYGRAAGVDPSVLRNWANSLAVEAIINQPSIFSRRWIEEARTFIIDPENDEFWNHNLEQWEMGQAARQFYREHFAEIQSLIDRLRIRDSGSQKDAVAAWIGTEPESYCTVDRHSDGLAVEAHRIDAIQQFAENLLTDPKRKPLPLPDYLGVRLWLGGRIIYSQAEKADPEVLAMVETPSIDMRADVVFTDRSAFLKPVRLRSQRTALLIAMAVLAAGVGWFVAWRAFLRQQQLAAMKDNFVSAVSHEMKAPITSIGLMAEELRAGSDKREEYTRLIAGECARLGSLVENVLDYARIESGSAAFTFEESDIGELTRAAAELMRPAAAERGIEIEVVAPSVSELCSTVDARAIGRALINLIDNAIKYAPAESLVTVTAEDHRITVTDRGTPIPKSIREQIFERFYRAGSELTRETKGVGIGLSLVRHIARAHGGNAWVESTGDGNEFTIEFSK